MIACTYMTRSGQKIQLIKADKSCSIKTQSANEHTDNIHSQLIHVQTINTLSVLPTNIHSASQRTDITLYQPPCNQIMNIQTTIVLSPTNTQSTYRQYPFTNKHSTPFHQQPYSRCKEITPFTNNHTIKLWTYRQQTHSQPVSIQMIHFHQHTVNTLSPTNTQSTNQHTEKNTLLPIQSTPFHQPTYSQPINIQIIPFHQQA